MPTELTPLQRLASHLLDRPVEEWIAERREYDYRRSWRVIANELARVTDRQVVVSGEALRQWYEDLALAPSASASTDEKSA